MLTFCHHQKLLNGKLESLFKTMTNRNARRRLVRRTGKMVSHAEDDFVRMQHQQH